MCVLFMLHQQPVAKDLDQVLNEKKKKNQTQHTNFLSYQILTCLNKKSYN
jgi:hypothetical protein